MCIWAMYPAGGWHLNILPTDWTPSPTKGINIEADSLLVEEGVHYPFKYSRGFAPAFYGEGDVYPKSDADSGSLYITKHAQINRILSGTFSFVDTNSGGAEVNVIEGRFDIRY